MASLRSPQLYANWPPCAALVRPRRRCTFRGFRADRGRASGSERQAVLPAGLGCGIWVAGYGM